MTEGGSDGGNRGLGKGEWALFGLLGVLLLASIVGFWAALTHGQIPHISVHGWIAMSIGILFSLLIGCGLMWLSFYSARHGFDDRADPGRLRTRPNADNQDSP
jgi:hypothetical protein